MRYSHGQIHWTGQFETKSTIHMYWCGTRKFHQRTRIIPQKQDSAISVSLLFEFEVSISVDKDFVVPSNVINVRFNIKAFNDARNTFSVCECY